MESRLPQSSDSNVSPISYQSQELLLSALAHSGTIGFAVCDERLHFQVVNKAWATMHGVEPETHLGATVRDALGPAGHQFEQIFRKVLSTGEPFLNYQFSTERRTPSEEVYWVTSCFPIKKPAEGQKLVAAVILEITQLKRLEIWSHRLLTDSVRLLNALFESNPLLGNIFTAGGEPDSSIKKHRAKAITPREREVIQHLARSKSNKEVAVALGISVRTIETYRARIMLKLHIHSLSELVHYAIRNGIVEP
jgi:PAS domain S-box-containing protein